MPRWCDRFGQYGIKVCFWGYGTLKIAIYVENYHLKQRFRLDDYHSPLGVGVLVSKEREKRVRKEPEKRTFCAVIGRTTHGTTLALFSLVSLAPLLLLVTLALLLLIFFALRPSLSLFSRS